MLYSYSSETEPKEEAFESTNGKVLECAKTLNNSEVSANLKAPQCHKSVLDFSRDARNQRAIEAAGSDLNQSLITDYNFVVDEVEVLTRENKILHGLGTTISQHLKQVSSSFPTCFPSVLQHLLVKMQTKLLMAGVILKLLKNLLYLCSFIQVHWPTTFFNKTSH